MSGLNALAEGRGLAIGNDADETEVPSRPPETPDNGEATIDEAGIARNASACHSYQTWRSFVNLQIET